MNAHPAADDAETRRAHARSFDAVADAYDRARPEYPREAARWLTGSGPLSVIELGAGTGKLTRTLVELGHDVLATEPSVEMLERLQVNVPRARTAVATAERIPAASRSADVVVCAQSFHWFEHSVALPEIARVLRPGGHLALVWNFRDSGIPWVRKLDRILGKEGVVDDELGPLEESSLFADSEREQFRFWQTLQRDSLLDLVRSRSYVALMDHEQRESVLERVGALYDDYGRGHDGMQLAYLTHCVKATVVHPAPAPPVARRDDEPTGPAGPALPTPSETPPEDPGTTLIDFR